LTSECLIVRGCLPEELSLIPPGPRLAAILAGVDRLIHHGITRRRPTAEDAAYIRVRDRTCRAPGCRRAARACDIDHSEDWASSKDSRRNLAYQYRITRPESYVDELE
jgi:hypothetical protein